MEHLQSLVNKRLLAASSSHGKHSIPPGPGLRDFVAAAKSVDTNDAKSSEGVDGANMGCETSQMSAPDSSSWEDTDMATSFIRGETEASSKASDGGGSGSGCRKPQRGSFFIETYGCQMNVSDSEVVRAILLKAGFMEVTSLDEAGVVLANTCAIRERAEGKVWDRLKYFSSVR